MTERLSDAVQKIKTVLFGERQRGMPENRVFLGRGTLLALFEDWAHHDRDLRVLYEKNQRLETENSNLQAERDALAAQVEVLGDKLSEVVELLDVDGMTAIQWLLDNCQEIEAITDIEPQQHLAEIRAEAGRAGYLKGHLDALGDPDEIDKEHSAYRANEYAATVRQGGAE